MPGIFVNPLNSSCRLETFPMLSFFWMDRDVSVPKPTLLSFLFLLMSLLVMTAAYSPLTSRLKTSVPENPGEPVPLMKFYLDFRRFLSLLALLSCLCLILELRS
jgi:hypothetical protein